MGHNFVLKDTQTQRKQRSWELDPKPADSKSRACSTAPRDNSAALSECGQLGPEWSQKAAVRRWGSSISKAGPNLRGYITPC